MSIPFIGQISLVAFDFAPPKWSNCDGQSIPIPQNTALFAILGDQYGGDLRTVFSLPDLRGRVPVGIGTYESGDSVENFENGSKGGLESVTLSASQHSAHTHAFYGVDNSIDGVPVPFSESVFTMERNGDVPAYTAANNLVQMHPDIVANTGGGQPHSNMQPSVVVRYIIALEGIFPPRN